VLGVKSLTAKRKQTRTSASCRARHAHFTTSLTDTIRKCHDYAFGRRHRCRRRPEGSIDRSCKRLKSTEFVFAHQLSWNVIVLSAGVQSVERIEL
jgi:hypothetical protein